jgi:YbbR domain-containing protein
MMKKLMSKLFKNIWIFIDKKIITPLTKGIMFISSILTDNKKRLERFLTQKNTLIFISLILSLILFFVVDYKSNVFLETSAEVLRDQPVRAIYNEEAYVVEGLPKTVDVTLIGRRADLYLAKQLPVQEVTIDLSNLKPGTHKIDIRYIQPVSSIDYKVDPSFTTIVIYPKVSVVKNLTVDLLNEDKIDPTLIIEETVISKEEVIIKQAQHNLDKVATVKALIDINNLPKGEIGEVELKEVPLIAYDESGNQVDVEIVPSKVDAKLTISSPRKQVPIKIVPVGEVAFGKAIASMTSAETTITIYGDQKSLADINYVPIEIDVTGLKENKHYSNISIPKPSGVRHMSISNTTINITLDEEINKEVSDIQIEYRNLPEGLSVQALSLEDTKITVVVKGAKQVVDNIDSTNVFAYIDLNNYTEGQHEVDVIVYGEDLRAVYIPKVKKVNIRIRK